MLSGKRILVAKDNDWITAGLADAISSCGGIADGAILDTNLLDGPITPVAHALCDKSVPLVIFTGLGLPSDLQRLHPDIAVILKPAPYVTVIRAIAAHIRER